MIPKKIHFIWFGGEKNKTALEAINTWKKRAPEYEIIEWNEHNLPNFQNKFYQDALKNNDYAFASDYARLKVLEQFGGIYMDTDMYLLKNPSQILKNKDLVFSIQDPDVIISTSFIAAEPNQDFIKNAVSLYEKIHYEKGNNKPNTEILSPLIFKIYHFNHLNKTQSIGKITAYDSNILLQPSFKTIALHIGEKTWAPHTKHDQLRIQMRQHIKNQFAAGLFRIVNDIFRKLV